MLTCSGAKSRSFEGPSQRGYRRRQAALHSYIADAQSIGVDITKKVSQRAHASQLARKGTSIPAHILSGPMGREEHAFKEARQDGALKAITSLASTMQFDTHSSSGSSTGEPPRELQKVVILGPYVPKGRASLSSKPRHVAFKDEVEVFPVLPRSSGQKRHCRKGKPGSRKEKIIHHKRSQQLPRECVRSL